MNKIGVAIIGAGLIGKKRAEAIHKILKYSLKCIYDISNKAAVKFTKKYHCKVKNNLDEILNDTKIDLVILAIRHKDAAFLAPKILEKKHLLMEKPLGRNLKETKKIVNAAIKYKHNLFAGFNFQYYPHIQLAKSYLQKNKIGRVISSTFKIGHAAFPGYEKTWKMNKELCGGGVILDPGVHMIDLMLTLIGKPQKQYVYTNSLGWTSKVEDEAFVVFEFKDKSLSTHHYSLNLAKNTFFIEIEGTEATLRIYGRGGNYGEMKFQYIPRWFWKNNKNTIVKNFGVIDYSFYEELKDINLFLNKSNNPDIRYKKYLMLMKLLDKIYFSILRKT